MVYTAAVHEDNPELRESRRRALPVVERYLDSCAQAGLESVTIIHGKGTGALRSGVQSFLRTHPRVKTYRMGAYGEGDAGVTVVTLK